MKHMRTVSNREAVTNYILGALPSTFHHHTEDEGTLIGLPCPYTVQGADGAFPEMYYWDSYFTNLGLLLTEHRCMAKNNTNNLLHMLERFGFVPNASRTWGVSRSQPPYLSMMVRDVFDAYGDTDWLARAVTLLKKEYQFWTITHGTSTGLSRHLCAESTGTDQLLRFYEYVANSRFPLQANTDTEKVELARRYIAEAETGWDFNPRFEGRCPDFLPVDLNSNLYVYESNFAYFSTVLKSNEEAHWNARAELRRELVRRYLWDESRQTYADYDYVNGRHSPVICAAMMHPLMANMSTIAEAESVVGQMARLEAPFGIVACEPGPRTATFQWDFPNGWPPCQFSAIMGLANYGFHDKAHRIACKYLNAIESGFSETAKLWEKYNAVDGTLNVSDEYSMPTFLGWTAGFYLWADKLRQL